MVEQAEQLARLAPVDREYLPTLKAQTYKSVNGYTEATANISPTARAKGRRRHPGGIRKIRRHRRGFSSSAGASRRVCYEKRKLRLRTFLNCQSFDDDTNRRRHEFRLFSPQSFRR
jgi:hypothetical protein